MLQRQSLSIYWLSKKKKKRDDRICKLVVRWHFSACLSLVGLAYLDSQVVLPVVGETLVELSILLIGDVVRVTGPDWLGLVQLLSINVLFLDLLLPLVLALLCVLILVRAHILNLRFVLVLGSIFLHFLFLLSLLKIHFLLPCLLHLEYVKGVVV